jgi:hypothetical protein
MRLLGLLCLCVHASFAQFATRDGRIIDGFGRERIFHGVNVVYKSDPYIPISDQFDPNRSFSVEDAELLQSLGLNVSADSNLLALLLSFFFLTLRVSLRSFALERNGLDWSVCVGSFLKTMPHKLQKLSTFALHMTSLSSLMPIR